MMSVEHVPVMAEQVVAHMLPLAPNSRLCDATFGGGGHTARLLELCSSCTVTAIDADAEMVRRGRERFLEESRLRLVHGWFDEQLVSLTEQDRILMDLGVSMFHMREAERGFSLRDDGPLDMRLDQRSDAPSARDLVERARESDLADVLFRYGEERYARRIARAVVAARGDGIATTAQLAQIVWRAVPPPYRRGRLHPATRTFQALRIAVNDELRRIERAVPRAARALGPGGRLIVISFHSLEDRIVKHSFRRLAGRSGGAGEAAWIMVHPDTSLPGDRKGSTDGADQPMYEEEGSFRIVTRKPEVPTEQEVTSNPASRSAKLRVLERATGEETQ